MGTTKKTTSKAAAKKVAKAAPKKAAPKKAAKKAVEEVLKPVTSKDSPEENTDSFTWTDELKLKAHNALIALHNRSEPRKNILNVTYHPDGTATCRGIVKHSYSHKI